MFIFFFNHNSQIVLYFFLSKQHQLEKKFEKSLKDLKYAFCIFANHLIQVMSYQFNQKRLDSTGDNQIYYILSYPSFSSPYYLFTPNRSSIRYNYLNLSE